MKWKQKQFDRGVQRSKCQNWLSKEQDIVEMYDKSNAKNFWHQIGSLVVGQDRKNAISLEVVKQDGSVSEDKKEVLNTWVSHFETVDEASFEGQEVLKPINCMVPGDELNDFMDKYIQWSDISCVIRKAKLGNTCGYDELL